MPRSRPAAKVLPISDIPKPPGTEMGRVVGVQAPALLVDVPGRGVLHARVAMPLSAAQAEEAAVKGAEAVLLFIDGNPSSPIVMGLVHDGLAHAPGARQEARVDGRRVVIEGHEEVVLKCGEATVTLHANGKIVISGAYVETHARGTNRIKGGSVQIN